MSFSFVLDSLSVCTYLFGFLFIEALLHLPVCFTVGSGPDLCCREASLWNLLVEPTVHAVGFNINLPPAVSAASSTAVQKAAPSEVPSFVFFGDDPTAIFGEMLWAERIQTGAAGFDALMHFSTYDWRLCGEQVGHPLSSTWEAIVDLRCEHENKIKVEATSQLFPCIVQHAGKAGTHRDRD